MVRANRSQSDETGRLLQGDQRRTSPWMLVDAHGKRASFSITPDRRWLHRKTGSPPPDARPASSQGSLRRGVSSFVFGLLRPSPPSRRPPRPKVWIDLLPINRQLRTSHPAQPPPSSPTPRRRTEAPDFADGWPATWKRWRELSGQARPGGVGEALMSCSAGIPGGAWGGCEPAIPAGQALLP